MRSLDASSSPRLDSLPVLSMRRVCQLADCSRSTVLRSPLVPVGRRGRTPFYATEDVLAWLRGGLSPRSAPAPATPIAEERERAASVVDQSIERIRRIGGRDGAGKQRSRRDGQRIGRSEARGRATGGGGRAA